MSLWNIAILGSQVDSTSLMPSSLSSSHILGSESTSNDRCAGSLNSKRLHHLSRSRKDKNCRDFRTLRLSCVATDTAAASSLLSQDGRPKPPPRPPYPHTPAATALPLLCYGATSFNVVLRMSIAGTVSFWCATAKLIDHDSCYTEHAKTAQC